MVNGIIYWAASDWVNISDGQVTTSYVSGMTIGILSRRGRSLLAQRHVLNGTLAARLSNLTLSLKLVETLVKVVAYCILNLSSVRSTSVVVNSMIISAAIVRCRFVGMRT